MINLLTVIGHGAELIPHFIKHYENQVDLITIVVYESEFNKGFHEEVKKVVGKRKNVTVLAKVEDEAFKWSRVTYLYNKIKQTKPDEWWVIADIDEFHLYPNDDLKWLLNVCDENNWEIVRGGFIDRVGEYGDFPNIQKRKSIFKQFPYMGFFRYPLSEACPNKIAVSKGRIELTTGQHYANINGESTWRWQGWSHPLIAPTDKYMVQVHHFKWDKTVKDRMREIFVRGGEFSEEYKTMYKALRINGFLINLYDKRFMFEKDESEPSFYNYKEWNKLSKKIISI